ncbi:hypothetical protein SFOMI_4156 [Sphingobium fuliginis]|uniref:Uncharacterized protein n=1 Tax=Sphingobium fuliginis (strain ATCC 27551) TaxID=336203 RepID=A0A292ZKE7_SPHSA|nr:hypothetical protein SFOMI_4156 [Sphingobium fuliginis]
MNGGPDGLRDVALSCRQGGRREGRKDRLREIRISAGQQVGHGDDGVRAEAGGGRIARLDQFHLNAEIGEFMREGSRESLDRMLGRAIGRRERKGAQRHGGRHVDDHARSTLAHLRYECAAHRHGADAVGFEELADQTHRHGFEGAHAAYPRIVDHYVDPAGGLDQRGYAVLAGDVQRQQAQAFGMAAEQGRVGPSHGRDDIPSLREEMKRRGLAIARRSAGDQDRLAHRLPRSMSMHDP